MVATLPDNGGIGKPAGIGIVVAPLHPQIPVQRPILDRLADILRFDMVAGGKVGNGAGHLEDAVVGSGAEVQLGDGYAQQFLRRFVKLAMLFHLARAHPFVAPYLALAEAGLLDVARGFDAGADSFAGLAGRFA